MSVVDIARSRAEDVLGYHFDTVKNLFDNLEEYVALVESQNFDLTRERDDLIEELGRFEELLLQSA